MHRVYNIGARYGWPPPSAHPGWPNWPSDGTATVKGSKAACRSTSTSGSAVRMRMHLLHEAVRTWTRRATPLRTESRAPHMRPFRPCVCVACHSALQEPLGECSTMECPNDYLMKDSMPVPPPNCHGKTCEACEPAAECTEVPAACKILSIANSDR